MYAPPASPGRTIPRWFWFVVGTVVLLLLAVGITAAVVFTRHFGGDRAQPGDFLYDLELVGLDGQAPAADAVERTRQVLLDRLRDAGVERPTATTTGAATLRMTGAKGSFDLMRQVLVPGHLTFRPVLGVTVPGNDDDDCKSGGPAPADPGGLRASAQKKLGETRWAAASALKGPDDPGARDIGGFNELTCEELGALPPLMQFAVPGVSCTALGHREYVVLNRADAEPVTACQDETTKYRLDVARLTAADLAGAKAAASPATGQWTVTLHFTTAGQQRWTDLTRDTVGRQLAILVDGGVVSAPEIQAVITGDAEISGGFSAGSARSLAANLNHGSLPTTVDAARPGTVS
ncbi:SecDF P1 head subdomain-containing protein [Dactylosporangium sp. NPDC051541]|uniref:SecDF P1 head subdomain-containing protein n=1 Tax=Dactylosporangium sp. NPDC051541 TaxID=3363977 RepID=UPI003796E2D0